MANTALKPLLLLSISLAFATPAWAIYKCESNEKTSYSDAPCPGGKLLDLATKVPEADTIKAQQRLAQQKADLKHIESERAQHEEKEKREQQHAAHAKAIKQKKCQSLALRKKWAEEDAARAPYRFKEKAKHKAQRATEKYALDCSKH